MKLQLVSVEWQDAGMTPGWTDSHKAAELRDIVSVGWILYKDKKVLKIAQTIAPSTANASSYADILCIPRGWIKRIRYL